MADLKTDAKEGFNKAPLWLKLLLIGAVILIIYLVYKKISNKIKSEKEQKAKENSIASASVLNPVTGGTSTVTVNLGTQAIAINDALHGSWFYEDEEAAMGALLNVPQSLIPQLSSTYFSLYNLNLKEDMKKYLSATEWNKISYVFG